MHVYVLAVKSDLLDRRAGRRAKEVTAASAASSAFYDSRYGKLATRLRWIESHLTMLLMH